MRVRIAAASAAILVLLALTPAVPRSASRNPSLDAAQRALRSDVLPRSSPLDPEDWFLAQRLSSGPIPRGAYALAARQAARLPLLPLGHSSRSVTAAASKAATGSWQFVGPTNIGGRVLDIAVDPKLANTLYVATASGGLWKSTNGGRSLSSIWPSNLSQPIGAVTIGSNGVLFAGTGETGPGGGSITYGGNGLYRSTDRGQTWKRLLSGTSRIARIAVDPKDPRRVFAAVSGDLFNPGGARGVYRSTDGGLTWKRVLKGTTTTAGGADLAIDPQNPRRIYAALWDAFRQPDLRTYGGVGSGLYRSTDGGDTWQRLGHGLPGPSKAIGRIGVAVAPSNPSHLYAIVIGTLGSLQGFYVSLNGGDSWTRLPNDPVLAFSESTYGWWFGRVWVDPLLETHVYVGGVFLLQSVAGGIGWVPDATAHADDHAMAWDPKQPGRVYLGNDGGLYHSDLFGLGADWTFATYQPYTQFYSVDVSQQDVTRLVGGAQDNNVDRSYRSGHGGSAWNSYVGGDGLAARIDPTSQNRVYGCSQYGVCSRSSDGGTNVSSFGSTKSQRRGWFVPVEFDPTDPKVIYYGGNILNRSTNYAASFQAISPDLTGGKGRDTQYPYGTITTVAVAKTDGRVIYVGTDDGRLWVTRNLGGSWTRLRDPDLPKAWVTRMAIDPGDWRTAYVTYSGFRSGSSKAYVLRTTDGGKTWTNITGNLPKAPVNCVVIVGSHLYVATDVGVFSAGKAGGSWSRVGSGLPNAPIDDLRYQSQTKTLVAATFGRGMWTIKI